MSDLDTIFLGYIAVSMAWRDLPSLGDQIRRRLKRKARVIRAKFK